jgi:hypothetical protein
MLQVVRLHAVDDFAEIQAQSAERYGAMEEALHDFGGPVRAGGEGDIIGAETNFNRGSGAVRRALRPRMSR